MKKWQIFIGFLVVAIVFWIIVKPKQEKVNASPFLPQTETVKRGNIQVKVSATGVIEPINKVEIKSKASGLIEELAIEEADMIKKNDLIARLDQRDTKNLYDQSVAELQVAEATVQQKESDFNRSQELYKKGLISEVDFDQAKLALVDAKSQLIRAEIDVDNNDIKLKDTIVRSPINGVVLSKDVEEGQIISSGISSVTGGTLIATVADMKQVYVKTDVDEVDIGKISNGMNAEVIADAYPDKVFAGKVVRIAAQAKVEQNVTSFEVTIEVPNQDNVLKAGMNAAVDIMVADKKAVLLVPNEALMTLDETHQEIGKIRMSLGSDEKAPGKEMQRASNFESHGRSNANPDKPNKSDEGNEVKSRYAVILKQGDDFSPRPVQVGVSNFDNTEVISGLDEGDQVVYMFFSRAKESSDMMRQRITNMERMRSGLRSNRSN